MTIPNFIMYIHTLHFYTFLKEHENFKTVVLNQELLALQHNQHVLNNSSKFAYDRMTNTEVIQETILFCECK